MSFESPDNEKNFPGLYKAGSLSDQTSVSEEDHVLSKRKDGLGKKKDGKKEKKEKGYMMFEEEDSEEEMLTLDDVKSPTKVKKPKAGFKFPARKDIFPKKEKPEERKDKHHDREAKKEDKKKEEKEGRKHKAKEKKKSKHGHHEVPAVIVPNEYDKPIFGVPLALAVERNQSHDGVQLPAIFRECIDYIEEYGLACEGIYRISGVKSKVQHLKDCYNRGEPACLEEHEPNVVASLLKQFLRDLPEPVLSTELMPSFEEASITKSERKRVEQFLKLIEELPICNRLLLSWMIVHMSHIIELQKENKMSLQNVSIVLSPTMQISHRVLNILFTYSKQLFADTIVKRYVPPLKPATSRWSLELPDNPSALEEELAKQESLLNLLHRQLNSGVTDASKEEQLWEVQRVVTQLKRKIKFAKKAGDVEKRRKDLENKKLSSHLPEGEELDLRPKKPEASKQSATKKTSEKEPVPEKGDEESNKEEDNAASEGDVAVHRKADSEKEAESQKEEKSEEQAAGEGVLQSQVEQEVDKTTESSGAEDKQVEATDTNKQEVKKEEVVKEKVRKEEDHKEEVEEKVRKIKVEKPARKKLSAQPHIHVSSIPLLPIRAEQMVSRREEEEEDEELVKKSVELRELEEELLGDGKKKVKFDENIKEEEEEEVVDEEWMGMDDEEAARMMEEEEAMKMEEEELLAIGDELRQKIETEQSEIERLHQEIQELQYLRQDSDLEDLTSSSESSCDSEDEEDLQDILGQLMHDNEDLEKQNAELCQKIHEERMICLSVKLQIRLLQQKQLETSQSSLTGADRETFL